MKGNAMTLDLEHNPVLVAFLARAIGYVITAAGLSAYLPGGSTAQVVTGIATVLLIGADLLITRLVRSKVFAPATVEIGKVEAAASAAGLTTAKLDHVLSALSTHQEVVAQIVGDGLSVVNAAISQPAPTGHEGVAPNAPWPDPAVAPPFGPVPVDPAQPVGAVRAPSPTQAA